MFPQRTRNKHGIPLVSVKILGESVMEEIDGWFKEFLRDKRFKAGRYADYGKR
ncbi:MAG: hypothetical protein HZB81_00690 [Deltaproteobacteria bacterium]|nr:hypothetical protein [Deltaproteobacteria bacterium]